MVWMQMIAVNMVVVRRGSVTCRGGVGGEVLVLSLKSCLLILCAMERAFATLAVRHLTTWRLNGEKRIVLNSLFSSIVQCAA